MLTIHGSSVGVVARQACTGAVEREGGNRVKLVSVVERERPKQCTIVFVVELGGARIRDEYGGNMWDAIIPALKHWIPSELRS